MADDMPPSGDREPPKRDFEQMLDLNRSSLIKNFVGEMGNRMRDIETAQADLKAIVESAKEQEFTPDEIKAMKTLAKLILKDKKSEARGQLAALERIGKAADHDLFDFAGVG
jgi:hypothetical protein